MADKKIMIREEYLNGIKAHNRSLVEDKNNLINKLTEAEDKILQLNSKIETLQEENAKLKKDLELRPEKQEEIQVNFTPEEDFEPISEPQYEPKSKVFEEVRNTLQNKPNIANNIQTEKNNSNIRFDEFPGEEIYQRIHVTPNESRIIKELSIQPLDYRGLSLATDITIEQLRTHKKDLVKKGIPIMTQKVSGFHQRMYIKPDTLKRFQITISN